MCRWQNHMQVWVSVTVPDVSASAQSTQCLQTAPSQLSLTTQQQQQSPHTLLPPTPSHSQSSSTRGCPATGGLVLSQPRAGQGSRHSGGPHQGPRHSGDHKRGQTDRPVPGRRDCRQLVQSSVGWSDSDTELQRRHTLLLSLLCCSLLFVALF